MQICPPLTKSQCKVSDTQVVVRPVGLLYGEDGTFPNPSCYFYYRDMFKSLHFQSLALENESSVKDSVLGMFCHADSI